MPFCKINRAMKTSFRVSLLLITFIAAVQSQAQQAKSPVQLGDQYFAAGEYYTAAHLYGQYLTPSRKSTNR